MAPPACHMLWQLSMLPPTVALTTAPAAAPSSSSCSSTSPHIHIQSHIHTHTHVQALTYIYLCALLELCSQVRHSPHIAGSRMEYPLPIIHPVNFIAFTSPSARMPAAISALPGTRLVRFSVKRATLLLPVSTHIPTHTHTHNQTWECGLWV